MNFKDEINLSLARLALGDCLKDFDLEDANDNKLVTFAVIAYLQGIKADNLKRAALMKLSKITYDSNGLLKPLNVLSDSEKAYVIGFKENQHIAENNNYDFKAEPKKRF